MFHPKEKESKKSPQLEEESQNQEPQELTTEEAKNITGGGLGKVVVTPTHDISEDVRKRI